MNRNIILFFLLFGCTMIVTIKEVVQENIVQNKWKTVKKILVNLVKSDTTRQLNNSSVDQNSDYPALLRLTAQ
jgi:formylmethanofuran:tetrahydromethanopterin formyltransferase